MSNSAFHRIRKVSDKIFSENQTSILYSINFFENLSVKETMWKNIVECGRPQMAIWRMCVACWIIKDTRTHSEYVILLLFHCFSCYTNAPQYYVIHTLPVLLLATNNTNKAAINSNDKHFYFSLWFNNLLVP